MCMYVCKCVCVSVYVCVCVCVCVSICVSVCFSHITLILKFYISYVSKVWNHAISIFLTLLINYSKGLYYTVLLHVYKQWCKAFNN